MTNNEIQLIAMEQSAIDLNCSPDDFLSCNNVIVKSSANIKGRRYLELPFDCNLVSYGNNIVASVSGKTERIVRNYIEHYSLEHCFETPNIHILNEGLKGLGLGVCFMAEYFLPDIGSLKLLSCPYEIKVMNPVDFASLYLPEWSNALCEKRRELDVLAVGAFDDDKLVGMAGCSADCEIMWQIGVDVLPEYRRKGIAAALTSRIAAETLELGKVPFYCAAWSNLKSVNNALKCGFKPTWVELTAKKLQFIDEINKSKGS